MEFVFRGDHLALDFLNTEVRPSPTQPADLLVDTAALAQWLRDTGVWSGDDREITPGLLAQAKAFRAALRAVIAAQVEGRPLPPEGLAGVNDVLRAGTGYSALAEVAGVLRPVWRYSVESPLTVLVPIATAAVALLTGDQAAHIRQCGGSECILYFLDTSKNHTRRWCSMDACGNRRKAAAHYRRKLGRADANPES